MLHQVYSVSLVENVEPVNEARAYNRNDNTTSSFACCLLYHTNNVCYTGSGLTGGGD